MSWDDSFWWPHSVKVRDIVRTGSGPRPSSSARSLPAEVIDEQTLVRSSDGEELLSSTRVTVHLDAAVTPGALVTVWESTSAARESVVLTVARVIDDAPLPSHLVLFLK